jgi:hypothetical protein
MLSEMQVMRGEGAIHPHDLDAESRHQKPEFKERRSRALKCKECESSDVWRVHSHNDNIFSRIWHRGLKPFQCRACGYCFYHHARRRSDSLASVNEIYPRPMNSRRPRIALVTAMIVVVVALLLAGRQWRRISRNQVVRNTAAHVLSAPDRFDSKRPLFTPEGVYVANRGAVTLQSVTEPLTNEDVIRLNKAGLGDSVIIEKMKATPRAYKLGTADLVTLKRAGISDQLISAMLKDMSR